jgi:hypothetical protein
MKFLQLILSSVVLLGLLWLGFPLAAQTAAEPLLLARAAQSVVPVGEIFTLEIYAENIPASYGAEIHLCFDPALLEVVNAAGKPATQVSPGDFINPAQSFILQNRVDNQAGVVDYALALLNPAPEVSGSGQLFYLALRAKAAGVTQIDIADNSLFGTRTGATIAPLRQPLELTLGDALVNDSHLPAPAMALSSLLRTVGARVPLAALLILGLFSMFGFGFLWHKRRKV